MNIIESHLLKALPVTVEGMEVQSPLVTPFGEGWYLTLACPWRGRIDGRELTWEDDQITGAVREFVGDDLVAVHQVGASVTFDFSRGTLTAAPDTDLDPWVISLPGGLMVGRVL